VVDWIIWRSWKSHCEKTKRRQLIWKSCSLLIISSSGTSFRCRRKPRCVCESLRLRAREPAMLLWNSSRRCYSLWLQSLVSVIPAATSVSLFLLNDPHNYNRNNDNYDHHNDDGYRDNCSFTKIVVVIIPPTATTPTTFILIDSSCSSLTGGGPITS
jgi:hypothetical protein